MTAWADPLEQYEVEPNGCWIWQRYVCRKSGYGALTKKRVRQLAHRFFFEHFHGPIPGSHQIHHVCGDRRCVNPAHLELLSREEHSGSQLTWPTAREIQRLWDAGWDRHALAEKFGIQSHHAYIVGTRRAWAHG